MSEILTESAALIQVCGINQAINRHILSAINILVFFKQPLLALSKNLNHLSATYRLLKSANSVDTVKIYSS